MKIKKLQCNFANNLYYIQGKQKKFINYLKKKFPTIKDDFEVADKNSGLLHTIQDGDTRYYFIWSEKKDLSVITHEVLHAVFRIAEYLEINKNDQEFFCYLQEDLIKQIIK